MNKEELLKFIAESANVSEKEAFEALEAISIEIQKKLEEKYNNMPINKNENDTKEEFVDIDKHAEDENE